MLSSSANFLQTEVFPILGGPITRTTGD